MPTTVQHFHTLTAQLAKSTGVDSNDVEKVLRKLGMQAVARDLDNTLGPARVSKIRANDLRLAVRVSNSLVSV